VGVGVGVIVVVEVVDLAGSEETTDLRVSVSAPLSLRSLSSLSFFFCSYSDNLSSIFVFLVAIYYYI
jgi:hypothetical protein